MGGKLKNKLWAIFLAAAFLVLAMAAPAMDVPLDSQPAFSTKTVAVCEYGEESVYCHDELVVRCGEDEYVLPKTEEAVSCGDVSIQVPKITAFAVFDEGWKDPRNS